MHLFATFGAPLFLLIAGLAIVLLSERYDR